MEARTIPPTLGLTLSIAALRQPYRACDIFLRGAELDRLMGRKVPDDEEIPLSIWAGLPSTYAPYDLIWGLKYPLSAVDAVGTRVLLGALYYVAIRHLTLVPDRHKERAQRRERRERKRKIERWRISKPNEIRADANAEWPERAHQRVQNTRRRASKLSQTLPILANTSVRV